MQLFIGNVDGSVLNDHLKSFVFRSRSPGKSKDEKKQKYVLQYF